MAVLMHERTVRDVPAPRSVGRTGGAGPGAFALAAAGVLFVLYPAIRPFSSETGLEGASAFASTAWVVAHSLAMVGFVLLGLGLLAVTLRLRGSRGERGGLVALVLGWTGIGLTLPYYGAEVFGLHAVGQAVLQRNDPTLMTVVDHIRWEQGVWFILAGLLALGVATVVLAVATWRSERLPRWSTVPLAVAFALYIPQYTTAQPVRVAHGLLVAAACVVLAWSLARRDVRE